VKLVQLSFVAFITLVINGCSSTPSRVDKGPVRARTFTFVNAGAAPAPAFADNREEVHKVIQAAILQNLAGKGLSRVPSGGDVTVAYLVIIGNNVSTEAINTYFGYGRDAAALHDRAQDAYTRSENPNYFEAGTLLIDIIDAPTNKLRLRNYAVRPVLRNPSADDRAANIQSAVDEALRNLRVVQ
jgi:hypothetical protein